jgi:hypothetical protein
MLRQFVLGSAFVVDQVHAFQMMTEVRAGTRFDQVSGRTLPHPKDASRQKLLHDFSHSFPQRRLLTGIAKSPKQSPNRLPLGQHSPPRTTEQTPMHDKENISVRFAVSQSGQYGTSLSLVFIGIRVVERDSKGIVPKAEFCHRIKQLTILRFQLVTFLENLFACSSRSGSMIKRSAGWCRLAIRSMIEIAMLRQLCERELLMAGPNPLHRL